MLSIQIMGRCSYDEGRVLSNYNAEYYVKGKEVIMVL